MNDIKEYKYLDETFYKSVKEVLEQSKYLYSFISFILLPPHLNI